MDKTMELDITGDGLATAETLCTVMRECFQAAGEGHRVRVTESGSTVAWITPARPAAGPDMLTAIVRADDIPGLRAAAMTMARELYGADAELRVEQAGEIRTASGTGGKFTTDITIRCLNYPREAAL